MHLDTLQFPSSSFFTSLNETQIVNSVIKYRDFKFYLKTNHTKKKIIGTVIPAK